MPVSYGLDGVPVLVTGAAAGIGRGIAEAFARQRAHVLLVDRDAGRLAAVAAGLASTTRVDSWTCDLTDADAVGALVANIGRATTSLGVIINNAGIEYPTPLADDAADAMARWAKVIDTNVLSMVRLTRALLPLVPRGGSIVNQSSVWGHSAVANFSAYVASKHAVIGLTRSLAWELAPRGIRVNAVCPGWVRTDSSLRSLASMAAEAGRTEDAMLDDILAGQPIPRLLEPADIAGVYCFLASDDASSITGQSIVAGNGEVML